MRRSGELNSLEWRLWVGEIERGPDVPAWKKVAEGVHELRQFVPCPNFCCRYGPKLVPLSGSQTTMSNIEREQCL
jgi:hypothetical protein